MEHSPLLSKETIAAIERGQLIQAIKLVRANTGLGLKESKEAVDAFISANPELKEKLQANSAVVSISREVVLIIIAIGLIAVYLKFFSA